MIKNVVILVAMAPLNKKSYLDQALYNKGGAFHLDDARIPIMDLDSEKGYRPNIANHKSRGFTFGDETKGKRMDIPDMGNFNSKGRFPANLLVSDKILDEHGKTSKGHINSPQGRFNGTNFKNKVYGTGFGGTIGLGNSYEDFGGFSRYFDLDNWYDTNKKNMIADNMTDKHYDLLLGDSKETLKDVSRNSVDLIASDPPYGLEFMGKDWDKALPDVQIFRECLRVLKPGHFGFFMCIPRSDLQARMIMLFEKAGFNTAFSPIYWCFASGFPKSGNLSKLADKRNGTMDKRKSLGKNPNSREASHLGADSTLPGGWKHYPYGDISEPFSEDAKRLDGMFTPGLKPAVEVILVAMKSLNKKSYLDQALSNEGGGFHLDDARIPTTENDIAGWNKKSYSSDLKGTFSEFNNQSSKKDEQGRFPANLLVSNNILDEPGKKTYQGHFPKERKPGQAFFGQSKNHYKQEERYLEVGGFSRYFSLDAWFGKNIERYLPPTFPFLIVPKPSQTEKNTGIKKTYKTRVFIPGEARGGSLIEKEIVGNSHPTVKSIKLFTYLCVLGLGKKKKDYSQTVLDPFLGSGTAGLAALLLGKRFIGCELNPEYLEIAKARIQAINKYRELNLEPNPNAQKLNKWF